MRNFHDCTRSTTHGANGMVATSSVPASVAALDVLRHGGNAVDAAVTASAVLCLCEPQMTGIGGDCFAIIGLPDGSVEGLNGSGRSSMQADADWLAASGLNTLKDSVHAVTVPGAIDAWDRLLARHGTITLGDALQPAITLAEDGVAVAPRTAWDWSRNIELLAGDEGSALHFLRGGAGPSTGEVFRFPALAGTLRLIAENGRDGFYAGPVAEDIVSVLAAKGGLLTLDDFAAAEATWVEPISSTFAGREVIEIPPNGQGITALIALNVLKAFDLARYAPDSVERRHLEVEAVRLAWVLRDRHVAEAGHGDVSVEALLSDETAHSLAAMIDMDRAVPEPQDTVPKVGSDTVYLSVVDKDRMAVSFINSVFDDFGSGITTPKTGVNLQNRGSGFVTVPGHPNCIGPGKRPLHTIIPAMVRNGGQVEMSFGVMGGNYQPMGHVAIMVNSYIYGMDPQAALDFPRAFHDKGVLGVETTISDDVVQGLVRRGHTVERPAKPWGGGQIIRIDRERGTLTGGSDHRKDGAALGW